MLPDQGSLRPRMPFSKTEREFGDVGLVAKDIPNELRTQARKTVAKSALKFGATGGLIGLLISAIMLYPALLMVLIVGIPASGAAWVVFLGGRSVVDTEAQKLFLETGEQTPGMHARVKELNNLIAVKRNLQKKQLEYVRYSNNRSFKQSSQTKADRLAEDIEALQGKIKRIEGVE